jgi:hypothetical protein
MTCADVFTDSFRNAALGRMQLELPGLKVSVGDHELAVEHELVAESAARLVATSGA